MAKTWFDEKAWQLRNLEHARRTEAYVLTMRKVLDAFGAEMSNATLLTDFNPDDGKPLSFANYPVTKAALGRAVKDYSASVAMLIQRGTGDEWRRSDELVSQWAEGVIKMYSKSSKNSRGDIETSKYFRDNTAALRTFQSRVEKGMHLSDKVWALAKDTTKELEAAIGTAIERGTSAVTLSKRVSKYLIDFESLKKDYKSKYGTAADIKNCEYRAARLARTEINMAYRQAENERWQQMDFVLGYRVRLSGAHPFVDMCNALQGDYPKTFKFTGWHPNCYCYAIPILESEDSFFSLDAIKKEQPITDLPKGFTDWEKQQEEDGRVGAAAQAGTLPYFLRDNGHVENGRWLNTFPRPKNAVPVPNPKLTEEQHNLASVLMTQGQQLGYDISDLTKLVYGTMDAQSAQAVISKARKEVLAKIAEARHAKRTEAQVKAIKDSWKFERDVMADIKSIEAKSADYPWIDFTEFTKVSKTADYVAIRKSADNIKASMAAVDAKYAELGEIIPDVARWAKQFSEELLKSQYETMENILKGSSSQDVDKLVNMYEKMASLYATVDTADSQLQHSIFLKVAQSLKKGAQSKLFQWLKEPSLYAIQPKSSEVKPILKASSSTNVQKSHPSGKWEDKNSRAKSIKEIATSLGVDLEEAEAMATAANRFSYQWDYEIRCVQTGTDFVSKHGHKFEEVQKTATLLEDFIKLSPQWRGKTTYRGISLSQLEIEDTLARLKDRTFSMQGSASWTTTKEVAMNFSKRHLGSRSGRFGDPKDTMCLFVCDRHQYATSIKHLSSITWEKEVLASKDCRYQLKTYFHDDGGRLVFVVSPVE